MLLGRQLTAGPRVPSSAYLSVMGLARADRSRVTVHDKQPEGMFNQFAA